VECFVIFVGIIIALALVFGLGGGGKIRTARVYSAYQQLARRHGGTYECSGWFGYPHVRFTYRGAYVDVHMTGYGPHRTPRGPLTQVTIQWPNFGFRCEVVCPPLPQQLPSQEGLRGCWTGAADFDSRYTIRATEVQAAVNLLNNTVRWQIERLRTLSPGNYLHVEFSHGNLQIRKSRAIRQYIELEDFVECSLEVYDQAMIACSKGIEFVGEQSAQPLGEVKCRVCGEEIQDNLVYCRRCKTPHHRECWQYNGACSVFGCGETRFDVPRVARRMDGQGS
jgi:hypothetical protein